MVQHFLLSKAARSLSLAQVARLSDDAAWETFKAIRWEATEGQPFCPRCGCLKHSFIATRKLFKCAGCRHQYSVTSGTIFASRKLPIRDHLLAIAIFANGAKGHSALQLSRDLNVQYRTAFVMAHKLREAVAAETAEATVSGTVEVDGAYFGGHVRPENMKADRRDRRLAENQTGKRRVVVVIRERNGKALTFAFRSEAESVETIEARVLPGSVVHADEAKGWDRLHKSFTTHRINHQESYSDGEACTNQAESYFARLRRSEMGVHHRIAGPYLAAYAREMAWRENYRRMSNGGQYAIITGAALAHAPSRVWKGYWQRHQLLKGAVA
ncbi:IS1595 family transposase [Methylobacterium sp. J-088]|uniref:IS1595 family transposase n=1 Tax=Methylobacterium sp. J-088 TaxID=2836664 RepID=UPI001FBBEBF9|nr:IS1595 family transposase [Methylobacterium sp. J-088]MCJ2061478.1 IS1595 family transposase [Methylobacterium sp. J-088]